jgi:hypothetical protein
LENADVGRVALPQSYGTQTQLYPTWTQQRPIVGCGITQNDRVAVRVSTNRYKKHRQNAADCFALAQQLSDPALRASMLETAQSWLVLADRVEQSGGNCKACDLPLPAGTKPRK